MSEVGYTLGDWTRVASMRGRVELVNALDDVWTTYLDLAEPEDLEDHQGDLVALADQFVSAVNALHAELPWLLDLFGSFSDGAVEMAFASIVTVSPEAAAGFDERLANASVLTEYTRREALFVACNFLRSQLPAEAEDVLAKRGALEAGEAVSGDQKPWMKCALAVTSIALGVAGVVITGGAAAGVAMSAAVPVASFVSTWDDGWDKCATTIWASNQPNDSPSDDEDDESVEEPSPDSE